MGPASRAYLGGQIAQQAGAAGEPQFFPVQLPSVRVQNVHVKKTADRVPVLNLYCQPLHPGGGQIHHEISLIPRGLIPQDLVHRLLAKTHELLSEQGASVKKSAPDERSILYGPCDIHRKAHHCAAGMCRAQFALPVRTALPGVEHVRQAYLICLFEFFSEGGSCHVTFLLCSGMLM